MSRVRIASITSLCTLDHGDDPETIEGWAGNQSPETFRQTLERPDVVLLVAVIGDQVVGVGGYVGDTITLNYVDPDFRFQGVSKTLMRQLESAMATGGVRVACLQSTTTARQFYRAEGWSDAGIGTPEHGYPMTKLLA